MLHEISTLQQYNIASWTSTRILAMPSVAPELRTPPWPFTFGRGAASYTRTCMWQPAVTVLSPSSFPPCICHFVPMATEYVVAIDLGTSCTAYSWKSLADPTPSVGVPDIQAGEEIFGKSPTSLLVVGNMRADRDFKALCVESYGRQAEENYATNAHPSGSQLFKRFKMVSL